MSTFTAQVNELVELFKPFTTITTSRSAATTCARCGRRVLPADQDKLLWAPHLVDWRAYWLDTHFPGLQKWTFDKLDEEFGAKPKSVYTYKELIEMFEAAVKLHGHRPALRLLRKVAEDEDAGRSDHVQLRADRRARAGKARACCARLGIGAGVARDRDEREPPGVGHLVLRDPARGCGGGAVRFGADARRRSSTSRGCRGEGDGAVARVAERLANEANIALPIPDDDDEPDVMQVWSPRTRRCRSTSRTRASAAKVMAYDELLTEPDVSVGAVRPEVKGDTLASLIFTSGTTGTPKGVMLTHKNFTSMVSKLSALFTLYKHDTLLSVLPLHHTFEFSAGFLMPLAAGASIDYLEEIEADSLARALEDEGITGMVGVPALWQLLERKIYKNVSDAGVLVEKAFDAVIDVNRTLRDKLPWDIGTGKAMFFPVHRKLGGRMRLLISGGSALPAETMKTFQGLGFNLYEGYGMTESSPVLTVTRPGDKVIPGSVGRPLPGIDVKLDNPDANGIGEVIAKGPNVMAGYFENAEATAQTIVDGWLHTGDLGKFDDDGNLFIVGRKKEMILGASGENIYPDELEEAVRRLGVRQGGQRRRPAEPRSDETVAMLIVPDYEDHKDKDRDTVRDAVREHVKKVTKTLPLYKRVKIWHLWDFELPKTSTRKIKRREVIKELQRLERAAKQGAEIKELAADRAAATGSTTCSRTCRRRSAARSRARPRSRSSASTR